MRRIGPVTGLADLAKAPRPSWSDLDRVIWIRRPLPSSSTRSAWPSWIPEMQLFVADRQNLHNVIRTKRTSYLTKRSVDNWAAFLKNVRFCDTPIYAGAGRPKRRWQR